MPCRPPDDNKQVAWVDDGFDDDDDDDGDGFDDEGDGFDGDGNGLDDDWHVSKLLEPACLLVGLWQMWRHRRRSINGKSIGHRTVKSLQSFNDKRWVPKAQNQRSRPKGPFEVWAWIKLLVL